MLSITQLKQIDKLKKLCEETDQIQLKLNEDWMQMEHSDGLKTYYSYHEDELIGFLGVYGFGSTIEACGMVHPAHRRKGVFRALTAQASRELQQLNYEKLLLNTPSASSSGKSFLATLPNHYYFTEYQMKWNSNAQSPTKMATIRPARKEDKELEITLDMEAFGSTREDAEKHWTQFSSERRQSFYIIEHEGKSVGKVRLQRIGNELWIYGFSILPSFQGKGIGKSALQQVLVNESVSKRAIHLEVQADNQHALELYTSCGFEVYHAQDYYKYDA
ncbi:GNAT family N-acetyltransferase [Jeotgalibacillus sp. S-D1]|uniref:GNAT family N-acetyltransferase n=1 Tax=Jeotgalibacillus sp. S-D1 TaxID=2552189 RepID=UPI001059A282|nr:GNAT family N-acetyltransferase [Jeotgalibacillus sp. S-D1]TDL30904.1 GNAT family N-acetyltransferase [Jeotgalibacillus sp. S-D1]